MIGFEDFHNMHVTLHQIIYTNKIGSLLNILLKLRKQIVLDLLSQVGRNFENIGLLLFKKFKIRGNVLGCLKVREGEDGIIVVEDDTVDGGPLEDWGESDGWGAGGMNPLARGVSEGEGLGGGDRKEEDGGEGREVLFGSVGVGVGGEEKKKKRARGVGVGVGVGGGGGLWRRIKKG